jgi:ABC-type oligopeptide transport system substrate-binding subunit
MEKHYTLLAGFVSSLSCGSKGSSLLVSKKKKKKKKTLYPIIMSEFRTADCSQSSKVTWAIKTNKSRRGRLQSKLSERGRECIKA